MTTPRPTLPARTAATLSAAALPLSRRHFVALVALAPVAAACGGPSIPPKATPPAGAPVGTLAGVADVPVGGGVIADDVVLTQPTAGVFEAFLATCTHQGCTLAGVIGANIECPCHGSRFRLDGTVANGPADRPLEKVAIRVEGSNILRG